MVQINAAAMGKVRFKAGTPDAVGLVSSFSEVNEVSKAIFQSSKKSSCTNSIKGLITP